MPPLPLDLPHRDATGREDFMVTASNALAVGLLDQWPDWPDRRLLLIGPDGSGKSHLARIWAAETGADILRPRDVTEEAGPELASRPLVLDDVDRALADGLLEEEALFHLLNACSASAKGLLLTARRSPAEWSVRLPDLASRLDATTPAPIDDPDDALLSMLLVKLFDDRQLRVRPALIGYLLGRMERSHAAARDLVARLDAEALRLGRPLDQRLAREVLDYG